MDDTARWVLLVVVASALPLLGLLWLFGDRVKREWRLRQWRRRWKGTGYPRWGR